MTQDKLDPRQLKFLDNYLNPESETFGNALQSALGAGYSQEYSESITTKNLTWLSENVGDAEMMNKTIRNLNKFLDADDDALRQADITKFVASTLGKHKFSTLQRHDHTTKGKALPIPIFNGQSLQKHNSNDEDIPTESKD